MPAGSASSRAPWSLRRIDARARLHCPSRAPVAQGIERCPAEAEVARSIRAGRIAQGSHLPHGRHPFRGLAGTITFLFTDIEGSTRLLQEHGEGYAALLVGPVLTIVGALLLTLCPLLAAIASEPGTALYFGALRSQASHFRAHSLNNHHRAGVRARRAGDSIRNGSRTRVGPGWDRLYPPRARSDDGRAHQRSSDRLLHGRPCGTYRARRAPTSSRGDSSDSAVAPCHQARSMDGLLPHRGGHESRMMFSFEDLAAYPALA